MSKKHVPEERTENMSSELERRGAILAVKDCGSYAADACRVVGHAAAGGAAHSALMYFDDVLELLPRAVGNNPDAAAHLCSGSAVGANCLVAAAIAGIEIWFCYNEWSKKQLTKKEFQIKVGGAVGAGAGAVGGGFVGANIGAGAAAVAGLATGGTGALIVIVIGAVAGSAVGGGCGRALGTRTARKFQTMYYQSTSDEEREFSFVIMAASEMGLLRSGHSAWGFTEDHVNKAYRRRCLELHPDQNPLPRDADEAEDAYAERLAIQQANFELLQVHTVALKVFIAARSTPKWAHVEATCKKTWLEESRGTAAPPVS